jgi:hypothetical protein
MLMPRNLTFLVLVLATVSWTACSGSNTCPSCPTCQASTPAPTPTPTPVPYAPPAHGVAVCGEEFPQFEGLLVEVQNQIVSEHPEWFDRVSSAGNTLVLRTDYFWKSMLDKINAKPPYSAAHHWYDPMGVIMIKDNNLMSENYKVLMSNMAMKSKYAVTCHPAEF